MRLFLLTVFCVACPLISLVKFRSVMHPHFLFTAAWVYLLPLGAVVSPGIPDYLISMGIMDASDLIKYDLKICAFLATIFVLTLYLSTEGHGSINFYRKGVQIFSARAAVVGWIGVMLALAEFAKQLLSCQWSLALWFAYCIGPRFGRPWGGAYIGGSEFMYAFIANLFASVSVLLPWAVLQTRGATKHVFGGVLTFSFLMMVSNGSRTPAAVTILVFGLLLFLRSDSQFRRMLTVFGSALMLIGITALMVSFRTEGLSSIKENPSAVAEARYGQDDNYFRVVNIICVDRLDVSPHLSPKEFFLASILNPIPRYFWKGKPLLTEDYFGDWKPFYATVTYLGEMIALFGLPGGLVAATIMTIIFYVGLLKACATANYEFGIVVYLSTAYYLYMAMRSMQNLGMSAVFLAFVVFIYWYFSSVQTDNVLRTGGLEKNA